MSSKHPSLTRLGQMPDEEITEHMPKVAAGTLTARGQTSSGFYLTLRKQGLGAATSYRIVRGDARARSKGEILTSVRPALVPR